MSILFFRILPHCNTTPLLKARNPSQTMKLNFGYMQFRPWITTGSCWNFCCSCCYSSSPATQRNSFSNCRDNTTRTVVVLLQSWVKALSRTVVFAYTSPVHLALYLHQVMNCMTKRLSQPRSSPSSTLFPSMWPALFTTWSFFRYV